MILVNKNTQILYYVIKNKPNIENFRYTRTLSDRFEYFLSLVTPYITKQDIKFRKCISAEEKLVATLRFLTTGDAQQSLNYSFWLGKTKLSQIVPETCNVIGARLEAEYLSTPMSEEDLLKQSVCLHDGICHMYKVLSTGSTFEFNAPSLQVHNITITKDVTAWLCAMPTIAL